MPDAKERPLLPGGAAEQQLRRLARRSFVVGGAAALAGLGAARWLATATPEDGVPWPLRRVLRFNEELAERLGSPNQQAPTFPTDSVQGPAQINGLIGLSGDVDSAGWELRVAHEGLGREQTIRLRDIMQLPRLDLDGAEVRGRLE